MIQVTLRLSIFLALFNIILAEDDEFYCRKKKDNWQVCRRCNETNKDCDGTSNSQDTCRCEDIQLKNPSKTGQLFGGWETCQSKGWCFVRYQVNEGPETCPDQDDTWYDGSDEFSPADKNSRGVKSYIWLTNPEGDGKD